MRTITQKLQQIQNPSFFYQLRSIADQIPIGCVLEPDGNNRLIRYGVFQGVVVEGVVIDTIVKKFKIGGREEEQKREIYGNRAIGAAIGFFAYRGETIDDVLGRKEPIGEVYSHSIRPLPTIDELKQYTHVKPIARAVILHQDKILVRRNENQPLAWSFIEHQAQPKEAYREIDGLKEIVLDTLGIHVNVVGRRGKKEVVQKSDERNSLRINRYVLFRAESEVLPQKDNAYAWMERRELRLTLMNSDTQKKAILRKVI